MSAKTTIAPFVEYAAESTTACLVMMVHGNVLALTVGHLLIASQTGIVAGAIAAASLYFSQARSRWIVSCVLGVVTSVVDYFVHPGTFSSVATEAVITGVGAAVLSYLVGMVIHRAGVKRNSAKP